MIFFNEESLFTTIDILYAEVLIYISDSVS